ncbi:unnamed protein product [Parajaminaea phylloscopi]
MIASIRSISLALVASAMTVAALPSARLGERAPGVIPTAPGPGDSFREGSTCTTSWTPDASGTWKSFNIELMTGSNLAMVKLGTVASGLDGTDSSVTSYSFPCPHVAPHSAIYFYQYTLADGSSPTWTTRWTIADQDGSTVKPANSTQPDGQSIAWGTGKLLSAIQTSSGGSSSDASASGTANSTQTQTASSSSSPVSSSSSSQPSSSSATKSSVSTTPASQSTNSSSSQQSSTTSQKSTSGAVSTASAGSLAALSLVAGVVLLIV